MSKHIYVLISMISILFITSCDLDREPFNAYTAAKIEQDKESAFKQLVVGSYSRLKNWSDHMYRIGEYPGDNIMIRGTSSDHFYPFINYKHVQQNSRLTNFWNQSYTAIAQASDVIKMVEEGDTRYNQELGEMHYIRGMCYFYLCRVFGRPYYQSPETNLGVPIMLNGTPKGLGDIVTPDRSTVKETYKQAISDLKKAQSLMTESKSVAYASKEVAWAMLSRIYLYMSGTYESANTLYADSVIIYADSVIASGRYELLDRNSFMRYNEFAPDAQGQTETIFAIKRVDSEYSGNDYSGTIGGMYASILGKGWGEMYASAKYLDLLNKAGQKNDARWAFIKPQYAVDKDNNTIRSFRFITPLYDKDKKQTGYGYLQDTLRTKPDNSYFVIFNKKEYPLTLVNAIENEYSIDYNGKKVGVVDYIMRLNQSYPMFYIYKCSLQDGISQLHSPIISRLGEMYLNLAEAYAKKGDYGNALIHLNKIRERSIPNGKYISLDASNAKQLINEERQLELAFEGHRTYDVFRNGETMERHYPGPHGSMIDIPATDARVVHYIPQNEIDAYWGPLTQNP